MKLSATISPIKNIACDENNMKEQKVLTPEFWDEVKHE